MARGMNIAGILGFLLLVAVFILVLVFMGVIKVGKFDPVAYVVKELAKQTGTDKKWANLTAYSDKQADVVSALTGDDKCKNRIPVCAYEMVNQCNIDTNATLGEPKDFKCSSLVSK